MGRQKLKPALTKAEVLKSLDLIELVEGMVVACAGGKKILFVREKPMNSELDNDAFVDEGFWLGILVCDVVKPQSEPFTIEWLSTFPSGHPLHNEVSLIDSENFSSTLGVR